jgi:hypothetical protein
MAIKRADAEKAFLLSQERMKELFGWVPDLSEFEYHVAPKETIVALETICSASGSIDGPVTEGIKEIFRGLPNAQSLEFVYPEAVTPTGKPRIFMNHSLGDDPGKWEVINVHALAHVEQAVRSKDQTYSKIYSRLREIDQNISTLLALTPTSDPVLKKNPYKKQLIRDVVAYTAIMVQSGFDKNYVEKMFEKIGGKFAERYKTYIANQGEVYLEIVEKVFPALKEKYELMQKLEPDKFVSEGWATFVHEKYRKEFHPEVKDLDMSKLPYTQQTAPYKLGSKIYEALEEAGENVYDIAMECYGSDAKFFEKAKKALPNLEKILKAEIGENGPKMIKDYVERISKGEHKYEKPMAPIAKLDNGVLCIEMSQSLVPWMRDEEQFMIANMYYRTAEEGYVALPPLIVIRSTPDHVDDYAVAIRYKQGISVPKTPYDIPFKAGAFATHYVLDGQVKLAPEVEKIKKEKLDKLEVSDSYKNLIAKCLQFIEKGD